MSKVTAKDLRAGLMASHDRSNSRREGEKRGIPLSRFESHTRSEGQERPAYVVTACENRWSPPFMPWFETDFQGSLRVRQLDRIARWIYGDLLRSGWHCDSAPYLPNDDDQLRAICDCPRSFWTKHGPAVKRCFTPKPDGKWLYHPKMVREYERALSEHQRKVAAGKRRWDKPMAEGPNLQIHSHEHRHVHQHTTTHANPGRSNLGQRATDDE